MDSNNLGWRLYISQAYDRNDNNLAAAPYGASAGVDRKWKICMNRLPKAIEYGEPA